MDTGYLAQQVSTIISQLHTLFDEIGVPSHERDARDSELFASLSKTLQNHVQLVDSEKNELIERAQQIITIIRQLEASLDDAPRSADDDDLQITIPLLDCLRTLEEKHAAIARIHAERFEEVKKLIEALRSYSSHLEPSFVSITLPTVSADGSIPPTFKLSPNYINSVDAEFTRVYDEYNSRVSAVKQTAEQMVMLWAELGTPQAQTDDRIIRCYREAPEQLGLHQDDMKRLTLRRDKLLDEKRNREKKLNNLKVQVDALWERLSIDEAERRAFLARSRGCGLKAINDFEDELSRLNELKRQNLHLFVEDARGRLQRLWDELYISEEEAVEFTPMFCDVYSDALLSAHEAEIERLESLKEQRAPTLQLIDKHRSLIKDREDLAAASQDASRLLGKGQKGERRDPTRLLREEKMRKRIAKDLPKVQQELEQVLEQWEEEYGRPFLVFGERYLDVLSAAAARAPPPRAKTPNGLPPRPAVKPAAASAQKPAQETIRGPSTMRPKTPAGGGTISRNPQPSTARPATAASNHTRSPSKIPSRAPLSSMSTTNPSPSRDVPHSIAGRDKENPSTNTNTLRKPAHAPTMAPPPKMRQLFDPPPSTSALSTPAGHNFPTTDFLRSGSIVRNVQPEDPYSSVPRTRPLPTPMSSYTHAHSQSHTMLPPPRPAYYRADSVVSTASSATSSVYGGSVGGSGSVIHSGSRSAAYGRSGEGGRSTRDTSAATASSRGDSVEMSAVSGSENWETYEEGEGDVPERDASEAVYAKRMAGAGGAGGGGNGTPRSAHGLGLGMTGMGMGKGYAGVGMGMRAPVARRGESFDDETF